MIDLHSHVLPGLDDGAADETIAVAMCRLAVADGIRTMVATPHFDAAIGVTDPRRITEAAERLRGRLVGEGIDLDLRCAAEMPLTENAREDYASGRWPALDPQRRYVLLEMPPIPNGIRVLGDMVFRLRMAGATPVLAHPERLEMLDDAAGVEHLRTQGVRMQVTASCLNGGPGAARRRAVEWLRRGWVDVVATDAHDDRRRPPLLSPARRWLEEHFGRETAERLTQGNPQRILAGEPL